VPLRSAAALRPQPRAVPGTARHVLAAVPVAVPSPAHLLALLGPLGLLDGGFSMSLEEFVCFFYSVYLMRNCWIVRIVWRQNETVIVEVFSIPLLLLTRFIPSFCLII